MLKPDIASKRNKIIEYLRQELVIKSPGFAAIAMWIPTFAVDQPMIACTDGKMVYLGNKFFESEFKQKEQMGIIVHEMLHIVFCHIQRFKKIERKYHSIANEAEDAIINHGIEQIPYISLPKNCVTFEYLLKNDAVQYRVNKSEWTSESLFEYLLKNRDESELCGGSEDVLSGDLQPDASDMAKSEGIEIPGYVKDIDSQPDEIQKEIWNKRLERARQGDSPGGLLRQFDKEFPKSKVDWRKQLRQYASAYLKPDRITDWARCSRRMLSTHSRIFTPGHKKSKSINRIGLVIDTSGSIDQEQLMQFLTEVDNIQGFASAEIVLIYADAEVAAKYIVKRTETSIIDQVKKGKFAPAGGGGSVFYPALEELSNYDIDVAIYLTDMYGSFPQKPTKFPTIWAATSDIKAPFGKTIYIN